MKILIATPLYPPEIGGPATYVKALEEGLPSRGIDVEVVKFSDVRKWPNVIRQIVFFLNILKQARKADVIFALDPVSVGWPSYFANLFLGKKFIVKIVGDHIWEQGTQRFGIRGSLDQFPRFSWSWHPYLWFLRSLQFRVTRGAHKVIVPSNYLRGVVRSWGIDEHKLVVVYNAVSVATVGQVPLEVRALTSPRVVSVGRLVPWKNMGRVIEAVRKLPSTLSPSLTIVGGGPLRVSLMRLARERLGNRALLIGTLSHEATLAVMQSSDVFVLDSSYEGFSHVLIEALSLGCPVIASRVGGNPELIEEGVNGLLVEPSDTNALTEALTRVLNDEAFRARLSQGARDSALRFSMEIMIADTVQALTL